MARRIKSKKRKYYGNRSFGGGNAKNRRGKGSRGGVGRAGYHKHKRMQYLVNEGTSTTAPGFVNVSRRNVCEYGLNDITKQIEKGILKQKGGIYEADLRIRKKRVKLLGNGGMNYKVNVIVDTFSNSAKEKIENAGGKIIASKDVKA